MIVSVIGLPGLGENTPLKWVNFLPFFVKNFPDRGQFSADVAAVAGEVSWTELPHFWLATGTLT